MPGKRCHGEAAGAIPIKESKAYCEGRGAAAAGALVGTNPHAATSVDGLAWIRGHESWTADPAGVPGDCCADAYGGGYSP